MTNRHVAELFAAGLGRKRPRLQAGPVERDQLRRGGAAARRHLLQGRRGAGSSIPGGTWPCSASSGVPGDDPPAHPVARRRRARRRRPDVVVIGYPAFDPRRNDIDVQRRVFGNLFNVKRLQPGKLLPRRAGRAASARTSRRSPMTARRWAAIRARR